MGKEENEFVDAAMGLMDVRPKLIKKRKKHVATHSDPREELKHLIKQHKALVRASVAIAHMSSDRKNRETGEVIPCNLPTDVQEAFGQLAKDVARKKADSLESAMRSQLKHIPIYNLFLKKVFGVGDVVAAYLVAEIDIHRAVKPSAIRRFCGLAVIDGRLERRTKGVKSGFSSEMRTRIYQAFSSMWKNGIGKGKTCKYLDVWVNAKHRKLSMATANGKINNGNREVSAKGYAHSYGWHKAADVFLEDLYIVWRAIEGLEVWPSYYAAKLGYEHGGKISVNAPKMLTMDEALAIVGNAEGVPHEWKDKEQDEGAEENSDWD